MLIKLASISSPHSLINFDVLPARPPSRRRHRRRRRRSYCRLVRNSPTDQWPHRFSHETFSSLVASSVFRLEVL